MSTENTQENHYPSSGVQPVDRLRTCLEENRYIQVRQILMREASSLAESIAQTPDPDVSSDPLGRLQRLHGLTLPLLEMVTVGCYWCAPEHVPRLTEVVEHVAHAPQGATGSERLRLYPTLLLAYAGCMAALSARRYDTLAALLTQVTVPSDDLREDKPLAQVLYGPAVIDDALGCAALGRDAKSRPLTPASAYLFSVLREPLRDLLPRDARYLECFDRFEALLALVHADLRQREGQRWWAPMGCFAWRRTDRPVWVALDAELGQLGDAWLPLRAGLFGGSVDRFREVKAGVSASLGQSAYAWW